jgi:hypothetical protein
MSDQSLVPTLTTTLTRRSSVGIAPIDEFHRCGPDRRNRSRWRLTPRRGPSCGAGLLDVDTSTRTHLLPLPGRAAFSVSFKSSPDPPRRPAPCLDIGPHPNQTRGEVSDWTWEIGVPAAKVVNVDGSLVAQSSGDLGGAYELLHVDFPSHPWQPNPGPPRNWGLRTVICTPLGAYDRMRLRTAEKHPRNAAARATWVRTRPVRRPGPARSWRRPDERQGPVALMR